MATTHGSPRLQAALAVLADVHEALEDAARGVPEGQRQALCRGVLTAAGAAAVARGLRAGAAQAVSVLPCMKALVSKAGLGAPARICWRGGAHKGLQAEAQQLDYHLPAAIFCSLVQGASAASVLLLAERAAAAAARLADSPRPLAAAAELVEHGARQMRLEPSAWAAAMWPLLQALQLEA